MSASALLEDNKHPTEAEIRAALSGNLCRCGTHGRIIRAIQRAAGEMA
jgi:aerobic-type carbon monoxide dehydrogenase small subunit (CoxS/CutS family)